MVRRYDPHRPVPARLLRRALECATRAPSAGFSQGWDFLVLVDPEHRDRFWRVCADDHTAPDRWLAAMMSAPTLIICLCHRDAYLDRYARPDKGWTDRDPARWPVPYWQVDTGMAALLMLLSAVDDGLVGCFFGLPGERVDDVRRSFDVPETRDVVGVVSLGYPVDAQGRPAASRPATADATGRPRRRPLSEVAHLGRFGSHLGIDEGVGTHPTSTGEPTADDRG
jgi:nitroreductase